MRLTLIFAISVICGLAATARTYFDSSVFDVFKGNPERIVIGMNTIVSFNEDGSIATIKDARVTNVSRDEYGRIVSMYAPAEITIEYAGDSYRVKRLVYDGTHYDIRYVNGMIVGMDIAGPQSTKNVLYTQYEYDGNGNWITRMTGSGRESDKEVRRIRYNTNDPMDVPADAAVYALSIGKAPGEPKAAVETEVAVVEVVKTESPAEKEDAVVDSVGVEDLRPALKKEVVVDSVPLSVAGNLSGAKLSRTQTKTLNVSVKYKVTGMKSATLRLTALRGDGSVCSNPRLLPSSGWADSSHRITKTFKVSETATVREFSTQFNLWLLEGVEMIKSVKFRIELLDRNGKVLARTTTNTVAY